MDRHPLPEADYFTISCYFGGPFIRPIRWIISPAIQCIIEIKKLIEERRNPNADSQVIEDQKARALKSKGLIVSWIIEYYSEVVDKKIDFYDDVVVQALRSEYESDDNIGQTVTRFVVMFLKHIRTHFKGKRITVYDVQGFNLGPFDPLLILINGSASDSSDIIHPSPSPENQAFSHVESPGFYVTLTVSMTILVLLSLLLISKRMRRRNEVSILGNNLT
ncbi:hypothetical protein RF11_09529 [Thelohanellus kitauei]|uniref:Uncharacterized protein n=1 Tax=Thelohanellus kitauei TaxID=669202 RepID=A0A0C2ICS0_THEKT|nr:hypothetical protein RF11_09529 [Thelohanellus kitauei]